MLRNMFQKASVIVGLNWISFINGFLLGQVPSMVNSLQKKEEGLDLSDSQISLIASTMVMAYLIGFALAAVADKIGRRWSYIVFSTTTAINWIILYYAKEMYEFILSRVIAGASFGALVSLNTFVTSEYTSPNTRASFLNMVTTASPAIGTTFVHAIGNFLHWRTVVLIGIIPAVLGMVLPYFWIESPHWLASKGKFEECQTAFLQLHGNSPNSKRELQLLIKMEKTKLGSASATSFKLTLKRLFLAFKRKYFWEIFVMSIFVNAYTIASGKLIFITLATVILVEITGTSDVFLFTLLIDGFLLLGSCMSCFLIRNTSMRSLLFSTGFAANAILVLLSVCFYFKNGQNYLNWIYVILLAVYFVIINAGPLPLLEVICSEIFPLELKLCIAFLAGIILVSALTSAIILLPYLVSAVGYHGLFLLNAAIMSSALGYVWWRLPETKGKTLQEIEAYFKTKNFDVDEALNKEHLKELYSTL